jgi:hypothetical protein
MSGNPFIFAIVALAIVNGIFSQFMLFTARIIITTLAPALLITGATVVVFLASLLAATATIILAGVPAAIFERATGRRETDAASYAIWLVTVVVISFPALLRAARLIL